MELRDSDPSFGVLVSVFFVYFRALCDVGGENIS